MEALRLQTWAAFTRQGSATGLRAVQLHCWREASFSVLLAACSGQQQRNEQAGAHAAWPCVLA